MRLPSSDSKALSAAAERTHLKSALQTEKHEHLKSGFAFQFQFQTFEKINAESKSPPFYKSDYFEKVIYLNPRNNPDYFYQKTNNSIFQYRFLEMA